MWLFIDFLFKNILEHMLHLKNVFNSWSSSLCSSRFCWHVIVSSHMLQLSLMGTLTQGPWVCTSSLDRYLLDLPDLITSLLPSWSFLIWSIIIFFVLNFWGVAHFLHIFSLDFVVVFSVVMMWLQPLSILCLNFLLRVLPQFELNCFLQNWQIF